MADLPVYYANAAESITVTPVGFLDINGAVADPVSVSLILTDPHGTTTTYPYTGGTGFNTVVKISTGDYALSIFGLTVPGLYVATWIGTGNNVQQVTPVTFKLISLTDTGLGMTEWYCSMEELKSRLSMSDSDPDPANNDYEIQNVLQAVTDWITNYCGRHFYQITETRTFRPDNRWNTVIDDVVSVSSVDLDYDGDGVYEVHWVQDEEYQLLRYMSHYNKHNMGVARPYNQLQVITLGTQNPVGGQWLPWLWPFTRQDRVSITGTWGWPDIPPAVNQAALYIAAEMFSARNSPFGVAAIADLGIIKVQASPWVVELLRPYKNGANVGV